MASSIGTDASMRQVAADIARKVTQTYTTRSPAELAGIYRAVYAHNAAFIDPFVKAGPSSEARLQFLALQRIFSSITAETSEPVVSDQGGGVLDVSFDARWLYTWRRDGAISRRLLPEATVVEGTVRLKVNQATHKVLEHVDDWRTPSVPALPKFLRALNARTTNAVFRLRGWEKELVAADKADAAKTK